MSKKLKKFLNDAEKTESKIAELEEYLRNVRAGNVTFQTTVNHENKTSEEAEMEDAIAKDA